MYVSPVDSLMKLWKNEIKSINKMIIENKKKKRNSFST